MGAATLCLGLVLLVVSPAVADAGLPAGDEVVRLVNARDDGESVARTLVMELIEPDGTKRTRVMRSFRRRFDDGRRSLLFIEDPANVKGTALLTWDYDDSARADDQWLYLPALRKSRRVAVADRGRAFLGSDFSFEDMKRETRLSDTDYTWETVGEELVDGHRCLVVEATPVDARTARELGYGRARVRIDAEIWMPRFGEYWDAAGAPLKTVRMRDIEAVQGIWTPHHVEADNLQTRHRTTLRFREVDYAAQVPEELLTEGGIRRGVP